MAVALTLCAPSAQAAGPDQSEALLACQALPVQTAELSFDPALPPKAPITLRQNKWNGASAPIQPETLAALATPAGQGGLCDVG